MNTQEVFVKSLEVIGCPGRAASDLAQYDCDRSFDIFDIPAVARLMENSPHRTHYYFALIGEIIRIHRATKVGSKKTTIAPVLLESDGTWIEGDGVTIDTVDIRNRCLFIPTHLLGMSMKTVSSCRDFRRVNGDIEHLRYPWWEAFVMASLKEALAQG